MFLTNQYKNFKKGMDGFSINNAQVFFWNNFNIWMLDLNLDNNIGKDTLNKLALTIDPEEKESYIKDVKTGSTPEKIAVIAA